MRRFYHSIHDKITGTVCAIRTAIVSKRAEGYVDSGVKILIAVVIGALILASLYTLFSTTIWDNVLSKIQTLFNYKG